MSSLCKTFEKTTENLSANSNNREATYAIKGYVYQFLATIEKILLSDATDKCTVEGVEDIDISSNDETCLVQFKYHETQDFSPSKIYKPIGYMFQHFLNNKNMTISYVLYAYFRGKSENINGDFITKDYLESCLQNITKKKKENEEKIIPSFSSDNIKDFKQKMHFEEAQEFLSLKSNVQALLKNNISDASPEDVKKYFYNNALVLISEISIQKNIESRKITKEQFLLKINHKKYLFQKWLLDANGRNAYIQHVKKNINDNCALNNINDRHLLIDQKLLNTHDESYSIISLIENLKLKKGNFNNTKLWTIILDADIQKIEEIKNDLLLKGIYFNDGYEHICFSATYFKRPYHFKTQHNNRGNKIDDASFFIKIISWEKYQQNYNQINLPDTFITTNTKTYDALEDFISNQRIQFYVVGGIQNISELNNIIGK